MKTSRRNLLLLSNSRNHGTGYLDHAEDAVIEFFARVDRILFVPFALHDQIDYWSNTRERFRALDIEVDRLEEGPNGPRAVREAGGIFVGGGNTFRLLDHLHRWNLIEAIRMRALEGLPYMGASAGTVIASPTLKTTNDMPIVEPSSFEALGLTSFQINCHYLDADHASRHMGETRELRIREFLEENEAPVLALREGAFLRIKGSRLALDGTAGARLFRRGTDTLDLSPGDPLPDLEPTVSGS